MGALGKQNNPRNVFVLRKKIVKKLNLVLKSYKFQERKKGKPAPIHATVLEGIYVYVSCLEVVVLVANLTAKPQ